MRRTYPASCVNEEVRRLLNRMGKRHCCLPTPRAVQSLMQLPCSPELTLAVNKACRYARDRLHRLPFTDRTANAERFTSKPEGNELTDRRDIPMAINLMLNSHT